MELRPAGESDLPGLHLVWWATGEEQRQNPWFSHVLRTGKMMVAVAGAEVVGFAGVRRLDSTSAVTDCFVHPHHQGRGIGTALLKQLIPPGEPVITLASDHALAAPLYRRLGMRELVACDYLAGDPAPFASSPTPNMVDSYPADPTDLSYLRHGLHCTFLQGEGFAAVTPGAVESSIASTEGAEQLVVGALSHLAQSGSRSVQVQLTPSHPAHRLLLAQGFQLRYSDTLMASPGAVVPDHGRLTFNGDFLRHVGWR